MQKVTSTFILVGLQTFTMAGGMHGLFESICRSTRIQQSFYTFIEGAMQVYHRIGEQCSPVFKEAQPRPSRISLTLLFMEFTCINVPVVNYGNK